MAVSLADDFADLRRLTLDANRCIAAEKVYRQGKGFQLRTDRLALEDLAEHKPGAGVFRSIGSAYVLSDAESERQSIQARQDATEAELKALAEKRTAATEAMQKKEAEVRQKTSALKSA